MAQRAGFFLPHKPHLSLQETELGLVELYLQDLRPLSQTHSESSLDIILFHL